MKLRNARSTGEQLLYARTTSALASRSADSEVRSTYSPSSAASSAIAVSRRRTVSRIGGDVELEVLADLVAVDDPPDGEPDLVRSAQGAGLDARDDRGELGRDRGEEVLALAGPLLRERRVAADDERLIGKVGALDLGQVALVEQAELEVPARSSKWYWCLRPTPWDSAERTRSEPCLSLEY